MHAQSLQTVFKALQEKKGVKLYTYNKNLFFENIFATSFISVNYLYYLHT